MSTNFGKAAEADWTAALNSYAARNNISVAKATLEFANTREAAAIYKRINRTPRVEAISKAAATGNASVEVLASAVFPDDPTPIAVTKYLPTDEGREFYADSVAAKTRAEQGL